MEDHSRMLAEWLTYNRDILLIEFEASGLEDIEDFIYALAEIEFTRILNPEELITTFDDPRVKIIMDFLFKGLDDEQANKIH